MIVSASEGTLWLQLYRTHNGMPKETRMSKIFFIGVTQVYQPCKSFQATKYAQNTKGRSSTTNTRTNAFLQELIKPRILL